MRRSLPFGFEIGIEPDPADDPGDDIVNDEDIPHQELDENGTNVDDQENSDQERIDSVADRDYKYGLVGMKIRGLYVGGWQRGTIDYYNKKFKQYHIQFPNSSEDDYIDSSDIDGVEMVLES